MRILLCVPRNPLNLQMKGIDFAIYPPLGLGYLASCLLKNGHDVKILDDNIWKLDLKQFKDIIRNFSPAVVGFNTYTFNINTCFLFAKYVKEMDSNIKVVLGGSHVTCLPFEAINHDCIDMVVAGEGEETMVELIGALEKEKPLKDIRGLVYKEGLQIKNNFPRGLIDDLDSIPFPAYDIMDMGSYFQTTQLRFHNKKFGTIITSRGCSYECIYCSSKMFGRRVRFRSPKNVVNEIELLVKKFGVGEIMFIDDTFTIDSSRVMSICDLILLRGIDISWTCNSRVNEASRKLYSVMRRAGCRAIFMGTESASQEVLDLMKKGITIEQVENAVKLAKEYIGTVICSFIFGMPGDTLERAVSTIKFAKKLNPSHANFSIACPIPGSEIFEQEVKKGNIDIKNADWNKFSICFPCWPIVELSLIKSKDLVGLVKRALVEFYFRPQYLWKRLGNIRSRADILDILQRLKLIFNYILGIRIF